MVVYYAIQDKTTGYFIPEPKSVGFISYTHVDCNGIGSPRLFTKEITAKRAMVEWLKGVHEGHYVTEDDDTFGGRSVTYRSGTVIEKIHNRIKENMHVVPIKLTVLEFL